MTDAHAVMEADRTIYTQKVVNRLTKEEKVIKASEHWGDDQALPLRHRCSEWDRSWSKIRQTLLLLPVIRVAVNKQNELEHL